MDVVTVNIGDSLVPLDRMIRTAASIRHFVKANPDRYLLGATTADLRAARASGRLAVCMDVEGVQALGPQVSLVEFLHEIGVRWMLLVYNRRNLAGSGCHDPEDEGLTELGRAILAEMDRVGMVKCCSHTGYRTAREILDSTDRPVIFSHSNPRALRDHPRNIPDELIRACAATGGVVGINGVGLFLGSGPPTAEVIVRNIDYVAQLVGAEHAALGLDYMFKSSELDEPGRGGPEIWPREWGYGRGSGFAPARGHPRDPRGPRGPRISRRRHPRHPRREPAARRGRRLALSPPALPGGVWLSGSVHPVTRRGPFPDRYHS